MKKTKTFIIEVTVDKLPSKLEQSKLEKIVGTSMGLKRALVRGVNETVGEDFELRETNFLNYVKFRVVESE